MSPLPKERDEDVGVSGFQDIKKIRGLIVDINEEDQPETWEGEGRVVKVSTEDTVILETFSGDEAFELKDGKFNFIYPYKLTTGGKIAPGTPYHKCWLGSAKEMGKTPSQFIGEYVTLEKQGRLLFQTYELEDDGTGKKKAKIDPDTGEKIKRDVYAVSEAGLPKYFCFVADESADGENVKIYIRDLVTGLTERAALRKLLVDAKAKQFPEFKDKLKEGTLAEYLDLVMDGEGEKAVFKPAEG